MATEVFQHQGRAPPAAPQTSTFPPLPFLSNHKPILHHNSFASSRMLYERNHTTCDLARLVFFTQHNAFETHLEWYVCPQFIPFYCWGVSRCVDVHIHSLTEGQLGCFHFGGIINRAALNAHFQSSFLLGKYMGAGLLGCRTYTFNKKQLNCFLGWRYHLHSHQQCMGISLFPHLHPHLFLSVFFLF